MQTHGSLSILKTVAYILAAIVLAFGLIFGLRLLAGLGRGAIVNLIAPYLRSLLSG